jgi:hypothetical protein
MRIPVLTVSVAVLALAIGCVRAEDEQRKADEARAEASEDIAEAQRTADLKSNAARAEAKSEVAEATANFAKLREDYRRDTSDKLVALDKEIADLEVEAKTATGKEKTELDAKLPLVRSQREAFMSEYNSLEAASATTWDAAKERADKAWDALKKTVDDAD